MQLALRTGIAPSVWAEEDEQTIKTAIALLNGDDDGDQQGPDGAQMSG